ncbi:tagaturonate reductase [Parapedobacter koreensis]|uniref:Tagaturonate reductase n=1 Tax=Parapedobacter koreensis TaxID=332977 RepID=A0A1H7JG51_9SPHI|nr:tagaturonate reductase [Parapedobacter koreensis]SEK73523.1 tagaturonate reductase [Parapedobacter koreensis]
MKLLNRRLVKVNSGPEKVLQFGTGVLLRGLPDYFIDKANKMGCFDGRIVVVKSTDNGSTDMFTQQEGMYTLHVNGIHQGKIVQEHIVISAITNVLSATEQWDEVLSRAENPDLTVVISNTTEVGIALDEHDDLWAAPPRSFPGKLTALLYRRFHFFNGDMAKGWVILPTELISDNGTKLKSIVLDLAHIHGLDDNFIDWLEAANDFCTTLVDRIVPGKLSATQAKDAEIKLGYRDELAIMAEPFRLWAIESDSERVRDRLSFVQADKGMVLTPNIVKFKELKLRLLNGGHTFSCGLAILCGFTTVKEAMQHELFARYVRLLMQREITDTIVDEQISANEAFEFSEQVIDRFSNPFLNHEWLSISMNYTSKMRMRNVASLQRFVQKHGVSPQYMALGFAGYLCFMEKNQTVADEYGTVLADIRYAYHGDEFVYRVLGQQNLWGMDLNDLPGFAEAVNSFLAQLRQKGGLQVIQELKENAHLKKEA